MRFLEGNFEVFYSDFGHYKSMDENFVMIR